MGKLAVLPSRGALRVWEDVSERRSHAVRAASKRTARINCQTTYLSGIARAPPNPSRRRRAAMWRKAFGRSINLSREGSGQWNVGNRNHEADSHGGVATPRI